MCRMLGDDTVSGCQWIFLVSVEETFPEDGNVLEDKKGTIPLKNIRLILIGPYCCQSEKRKSSFLSLKPSVWNPHILDTYRRNNRL